MFQLEIFLENRWLAWCSPSDLQKLLKAKPSENLKVCVFYKSSSKAFMKLFRVLRKALVAWRPTKAG